jgi:hypothetical protein
MKNFSTIVTLLFIVFYQQSFGQNPVISHIYTADPSAHVWPNDTNTLWVYTSHDVPGTNTHATMSDYHVFSTQDLINWTDHGRILSIDNVDWGMSFAWACDAAYRNGKYYLVFCMFEEATGLMRTGLAISDAPQGPFKDIGYIKGIYLGQDPCLFIDDDNTPYLFWGAGKQCWAAELTDDLLVIRYSTVVDLSDQLFEFFEGPWVHKYNGKYYLSYPGLPDGKWPEEMYYAIADNPLGPYKYTGKYIPHFKGQSGTNHGSIIKWKNKWIAFHHSSWLSNGQDQTRSIMADYLEYNNDGSILPITPTTKGTGTGKTNNCVILLEAENGEAAGGKLAGTHVESNITGYSGHGYVTGFNIRQDFVEVLVQTHKDMKAKLKIRLSANQEFYADILVGPTMLGSDWVGIKIPKTNGWEEIDLGEIQLNRGDTKIRFASHNVKMNLLIDYFKIEPIKE